MTTATTNAPVDHTGDTGLRAWIIDFHLLLTTAGLVQTADTGQVNTGTVTRASVNSTNAFSTWRLPDSSLYFRFSYGTDFTNTARMDVQVGEGTNGTGTLTGQTSTNLQWTVLSSTGSGVQSTTLPFTSYCCVTNDFLGIIWKMQSFTPTGQGVGSRCHGALMVAKTVDNTGAATSLGYFVARSVFSQAGGSDLGVYQSVRRAATAQTFAQTNSAFLIPGGSPSTSLDANGDTMIYTVWGHFPQVLPIMHVAAFKTQDIQSPATFTCAMVGVTSHTYLTIGSYGALNNDPGAANSNFKLAMLWE